MSNPFSKVLNDLAVQVVADAEYAMALALLHPQAHVQSFDETYAVPVTSPGSNTIMYIGQLTEPELELLTIYEAEKLLDVAIQYLTRRN